MLLCDFKIILTYSVFSVTTRNGFVFKYWQIISLDSEAAPQILIRHMKDYSDMIQQSSNSNYDAHHTMPAVILSTGRQMTATHIHKYTNTCGSGDKLGINRQLLSLFMVISVQIRNFIFTKIVFNTATFGKLVDIWLHFNILNAVNFSGILLLDRCDGLVEMFMSHYRLNGNNFD